MKRLRIALWIGIATVSLALAGVWGFAWYYFVFSGNGKNGGEGGAAEYEESSREPEEGQTLAGTVKDEETGEPVAGASVQWQSGGSASSVFSDEDGTFFIPELIPGDYEIRVTKEGYLDKDGIGVEVEEGVETVLLDDILMRKELNYYRFIRDELLPQMGYASTETATTSLTSQTASANSKWDTRSGILSADIADLDGNGTKDLLVYYFGEENDVYSNGETYPTLFASLYTNNGREIYLVNTVRLDERIYANSYNLIQAGIMMIGGQPFIYAETNSNAYFADGGTFAYTWYGYDGTELRPYWMVGKTDGGTSDIADSLLTYSDAQNYTKLLLWADTSYLYSRRNETPLAGSHWENRMDGIKMGFARINLPEPVMGDGHDGYDGTVYPTYWTEDYLTKTLQYKCIGTGSYTRRDMQVSVSDHTSLKEHIEALED